MKRKTQRIIRRSLSRKRFSAEDAARLIRYLTNRTRIQSLATLAEWFDGPTGDRDITVWVER